MRTLLPLLVLLAGCIDSEVGTYTLSSVNTLVRTCAAGVPTDRSTTWQEAMAEEPINELRVGSADSGDADLSSQAQFFRAEDSVFLTRIQSQGGGVYGGETITENATVASSGLGSDFSALLEADSVGCEFDLRVDAELDFGDDSFDEADGRLTVEVFETQLSDDRCSVQSCLVEYGFIAAHSTGNDPGIRD